MPPSIKLPGSREEKKKIEDSFKGKKKKEKKKKGKSRTATILTGRRRILNSIVTK
jgi:hypothetical protein